MDILTDDEFSRLIGEALDQLPQKYTSRMDNVVVTYADEPSSEQREKLRLRGNQSLYGLYEGIPLPARGANYNMVLPDKITLFKYPLLFGSGDFDDFKANIKHTLWHELAHHFGLDHDRIHELEDNHRQIEQ